MTRERAKELLPIIQAYADGETIQFWDCDEWTDILKEIIISCSTKYRIKPKPREFTMGIGKNGNVVYIVKPDGHVLSYGHDADEGIIRSSPATAYDSEGAYIYCHNQKVREIKVREILE